MGLIPGRDRLCLVQLSAGDGNAHLVQFEAGHYDAPNLKRLLTDPAVTKLFHFGRFDIAVMKEYLGVTTQPRLVYCIQDRSRGWCAPLPTGMYGSRTCARTFINVDLSKQQQSSDWGADTLTDEQQKYAASDVLYLHQLREKLDMMLAREGRHRTGARLFRVPAQPRQARSRRLARVRYLHALRPCPAAN